MNIATAGERPELLVPAWERTKDTMPEYNNHGDVLNEYWPRLTQERQDFQFPLVDDRDAILARAPSIPVRWDGTVERYPLVPIERYAEWRRPDGQLFDPWMRVHERLGATVLAPEPQSLRITGTVEDWETWTEMSFPESGDYWFPGGLATVRIDRGDDSGSYWEPNVWMRHAL